MANQWVYVPTAAVVLAKPIKQDQPVKVCINNQVATTEIPKSKRNMGYEELTTFMQAHPLNGAYFNTLPHLYPDILNELWYTCHASDDNTHITGTICNGNRVIDITQELVRKVLDLPTGQEFEPIPTKEEARASLAAIGYTRLRGQILYSAFTPRWKFLISGIIRSLGGKSGSTGELNEFETIILSTYVTGLNINYAQLYFEDLLKLVISSTRIFNVPFIRLLSLMIESYMGPTAYFALSSNFAEIPVPVLTSKVFGQVITPNEVPITASMQFWIDHPYEEVTSEENISNDQSSDSSTEDEDESDNEGVADEVHASQSGTSESVKDTDSDSGTDHPSPKGKGMASNLIEDMNVNIPSRSTQSSSTKDDSPMTNPIDSPINAENSPYSPPPNIEFVVEEDSPTLLESVIPSTTQTTGATPSIALLDSNVAAAILTQMARIEEDVPILDTTTQSLTSLSMTSPIYTPSPSLVHVYQSKFLHKLARVANVSVMSQTETQTPKPSIPSDLSSFQQVLCEGMTTSIPTTSMADDLHACEALEVPYDSMSYQQTGYEGPQTIPLFNQQQPTHFEAPKTILDVLKAIDELSTKFDVKFGEVQSEINNNRIQLDGLKGLVAALITEVGDLKNDVKKGENPHESKHDKKDHNNDNNNNDDDSNDGDTEGIKEKEGETDAQTSEGAQTVQEEEICAQTSEGAQTQGEQHTESDQQTEEMAQTEEAHESQTQGELAMVISTKPQPLYLDPLSVFTVFNQQVDEVYRATLEKMKETHRFDEKSGKVKTVDLSYQRKRKKSMAKRSRLKRAKVVVSEDSDDNAPISTILKKIKKGKTGGSQSVTQTETQHVSSTSLIAEEVEVIYPSLYVPTGMNEFANRLKWRKSNLLGAYPFQSKTMQEVDAVEGKGKKIALSNKEKRAMLRQRIAAQIEELNSRNVEEVQTELLEQQAEEMGISVAELLDQLKVEELRMNEEAAKRISITEKGECSNVMKSIEEMEEVESIEEIEKKFAQLEKDEMVAAGVQKKEDVKAMLRSTFSKQRFRNKIEGCDLISAAGKVQIDMVLSDKTHRRIDVDDLHTLGFKEWKVIAAWTKKIDEKKLRHKLKAEITYLVEVCHNLKLITDEEYRVFCVSNKMRIGNKSAGLATESKSEERRYPVPKGIVFIDRTYAKVEGIEGLCFKDINGVECFQRQDTISTESLHHCVALLNECEDPQAKPFRKRLVSWLFNNLLKVKRLGGLDKLCDELILEYQKDEGLSYEELKTRVKRKRERMQEEQERKRLRRK